MPPERFAPDDPREWLRQAQVDLRVARLAADDLEREPFAFHAQQAAEKALKAVLLTRGIRFPFVHDLDDCSNCWSGTVSPRRAEAKAGA